jgi:hypothetical protein
MTEPYREHPDEEALERFLLNMSPEEELEIVETHALVCGYCVEQLEALETEIAVNRLALKELEAERIWKASVPVPNRWRGWYTGLRLSFAASGVAAAAAVILFSIPRDVIITAYRGTETVVVSEGRPLHMHLNAVGLAAGPIAVELAENNGAIVWRGTSLVRNDNVDVTLPRITKSGAHFLRLYSPTHLGSEGELLREFALDAKWTR